MRLSDLSDELYHYGVKGMKWGVRKKVHPHTETNPAAPLRNAWLSLTRPSSGGYGDFEEEEYDPEVEGGPALDLEDDAYSLKVEGKPWYAKRVYFDSVEARAAVQTGKNKIRKANWLRAKPIASQIASARVRGRSFLSRLFNVGRKVSATTYQLGGGRR